MGIIRITFNWHVNITIVYKWKNELFNSHRELCSEGGYGINTQVEKSKNMTIVKFMECDFNQLF